MAEPHFAAEDDLPRTFRREREARDREAREREAQFSNPHGAGAAAAHAPRDFGAPSDFAASAAPDPLYAAAGVGTVTRFDVPFLHLMTFFLKSVVAAIPALILLTVILWFFGQALQTFFPDLVKLKILIGFQG